MKNKKLGLAIVAFVASVWVAVVSTYAVQIQGSLAKGEKPKMIPFDGGSCSSTTTTSTSE